LPGGVPGFLVISVTVFCRFQVINHGEKRIKARFHKKLTKSTKKFKKHNVNPITNFTVPGGG
ncbi:hypothetical protein ABM074_19155, partial [Morganella morganii]|uniref:hypothetical protein n=1 Tax=Morganella morganii TaxID=582 RepID=UPI003EBFEF7D